MMLEGLIDRLAEKAKVIGLVKQMRPLDVVRVLADDLGLSAKDASTLALGLIKQVEGFNGPSIERGQYPVPPQIRRDNEKEESMGGPGGKTVMNPGPDTIKRYHFPQDPESQPQEWPFDDHTVQGMATKNKQHKRGLTSGKDNSDTRKWKSGNPFNTNHKINQPGGDAGADGIYSKRDASGDGSMPGSGRSFVARGTKGFNSMPGKEFDMPPPPNRKTRRVGEVERPPNAGDNEEGEPQFLKRSNTGATSAVSLGVGGTAPPRLSKAGYRGYGRK